jgi:molybdate transport system substrate-binding protein
MKKTSLLLSFILFLFLSVSVCPARQKELRVAAAADLQFAMPELARQFEKQSGVTIVASYGSSGNFFAQIQNGAPFDLFFSADIEFPRKLEAAGLCEPQSLIEYARGKIVLWSPKGSQLDPARNGWKSLLDSRVRKIAIANPAHAPYGRAAVAALQKAGLYDHLRSKLVFGENISQAAQFVQSGDAQIGIVALSLVLSPAMEGGQSWEIPADFYSPLAQGAVILKSSGEKAHARAFLDFVRSSKGREILARYGFQTSGNN